MMPEAAATPTPTVASRWGPAVSTGALCSVYVLFAYAHVVSLRNEGFRASLALLVVFETIMVGLVFVRRASREADMSVTAVVAGLVGSFAALGFRPVTADDEPLVGTLIQLVGITLQLGASFSLGRSFGLVPANRGVKTGGLYRVVRHPFYFSYLVTQAGYIISNPSARNVAVALGGVSFQVLRIRYEERLLSRDPDYLRYTGTVRWHLVPGVW
jgi:protein-S-isoprenylcysteine O-methyltransferase Ste14